MSVIDVAQSQPHGGTTHGTTHTHTHTQLEPPTATCKCSCDSGTLAYPGLLASHFSLAEPAMSCQVPLLQEPPHTHTHTHTHTYKSFDLRLCWLHRYSSFYTVPLHPLHLDKVQTTPSSPDIAVTNPPSVPLLADPMTPGLSTSFLAHGMPFSSLAAQTTSSLASSHLPSNPGVPATSVICP